MLNFLEQFEDIEVKMANDQDCTQDIKNLLDNIDTLKSSDDLNKKILSYNLIQKLLKIVDDLESELFTENLELNDKLINLKDIILSQDYKQNLNQSNKNSSSNTKSSDKKNILQICNLLGFDQDNLLELQNDLIKNFFNDIYGNVEANKQLSEILKKEKGLSPAQKDIIKDLRYISHKTTEIKDFEKIKEKFESGIEKIQKNESIPYKDQISIKEYGILSDFVKAKELLEKYSNFDFVKELYEQIAEVEEILDLFEERFIEEQKYKNGDIVMYDIEKENQFKNVKEFTKEQKGIWYFLGSKYAHAAQINISESNTPKLSHVYGQYENDTIKFQQSMFSDIYRFNASKLLTNEGIEKAKEKFGENWQDKINEIYQNSQSDVYEKGAEERFDSLKNSEQKRLSSGKADFMFHGHKTNEEQDFKELSEKFYQRDGVEVDDNIMICSEFVTRSTIASLIKSNEKLSEELGIDNALQIPFSKNEDLNKVHTQRLIDILMEKECITQVRKPNIETMLFKEPEKAHYKTIMNMTKVVEDQLREFEDSVIDNQLPGQKHEKVLRLTESLIDKFVATYNKNNPYDAIEISPKQQNELKAKLNEKVSELVDKSKEFSDDISMRKGMVAYFCYQICDPILKYFGKTTYKEEEMAKSLENELSTFASTVRDTGVKGATSDVVKHDKIHDIIREHDDAIKRDDSFVQKSQQSRNNNSPGRI